MSRKTLSANGVTDLDHDTHVQFILYEVDDGATEQDQSFPGERVMSVELRDSDRIVIVRVPLTTFEGLVITALRVIPRWEEMFQWRLQQDAER